MDDLLRVLFSTSSSLVLPGNDNINTVPVAVVRAPSNSIRINLDYNPEDSTDSDVDEPSESAEVPEEDDEDINYDMPSGNIFSVYYYY
jgi:hypothetical protein